MSSGTKILLAVVTLFVGTLVIYYGFVMPGDEELPPDGAIVDAADDPAINDDARETERPRRSGIDRALAAAAEPDPLLVMPTATARTPVPNEPAGFAPAAGGTASVSPEIPAAGTPTRTPTDTLATRTPTQALSPDATTRDRAAAIDRAPAVTRAVPAAPKYTPYTVEDGDTMTSIAAWWFGDHRKWDLIAKANLVDPNRLRVGQVLRLPPKSAERPPVEPRAGAERAVHTVGPGDSLSSIAVAHYGDIAQWERIYRANRALIGADPDALAVGMKLTIPAVPARTSSAESSK